MKKILSYGFMIGVLGLCLALSVGMLFAGPGQPAANEHLSDAPALTKKDGSFNEALLSDTASWVNDRFFGRKTLISVNNRLNGTLFGVSGSEDVILGKDGWLFYGSTLADYTGTEPMTARELFCAARNVMLMEEYCASQGKAFAFTIAPNKNSLYGEYMPPYAAAPSHNARMLEEDLEAAGVNYADLFTAIGNEPQILYFAHDSHWNSQGAALGADTINHTLGRESSYYGADFSQSHPHAGDLYEMLYPAFTDTETDPVFGGGLEYTFTGSSTKADSITLLTQSDGEGSLLCYRDSFGNLLYPYLADSFGSARFSRSTTYDLTPEADYVLIELVERNLGYLITNLPVLMAPRRELTLPETGGSIVLSVSPQDKPEGTLLVEGQLPADADVTSAVYIVCAGGCYEASLLKDGGFGAYIPYGETVSAVAYYAGGELQLLTKQIEK